MTISTDQPMTMPNESDVIEDDPKIHLTRNILRDLGSCGTYLRRFDDLFPRDRYPNGVPITEETCTKHVDMFDWTWACENLLSYEGQSTYRRLVQDRTAAVRARHGTGDAKRASVLGYLFENHPELRSERFVDAVTSADERADRRELRRLADHRAEMDRLRDVITTSQQRLADYERTLPKLEVSVAPVLRRQAARDARAAQLAVAAQERRLERARERVVQAVAELDRVTALTQSIESATESAIESATEPSASQ